MQKNIETLVEDICAIAPELAEKKEDVRRLVSALLDHKPDVTIDPIFVEDLRQKLHDETVRMSDDMLPEKVRSTFMHDIFQSKLAWSFAVVVLVVLVASPFFTLTPRSQTPSALKMALAPKIEDVGRSAFGTFVSSESIRKEGADTKTSSYMNVETIAEDATMAKLAMPSVAEGGMGGDASISLNITPDVYPITDALPYSGKMIAPDWQMPYPVYIYNGELPTIDPEGYVYRRVLGTGSADTQTLVNSFNLGLIDVGSFGSVGVSRLELTSKQDPAYNISIDLDGGEISIYRAWTGRYDNEVEVLQGVQYSEIDTAQTINIAQTFLAQHSIDVSSYGTPVIEAPMFFGYMSSDNTRVEYTEPIYSVNIRYPLIIDGMKVVESSGYPIGISVSVDVVHGRVESVNGLMTQNYQRSLYSLVQDTKKIQTMIQDGGYEGNMYMYPESPNMQEKVSLVEPERVLMKYWKYEEGQVRHTELLIPALMFPVDQTAFQKRSAYVRQSVIVPLVEEFLKEVYEIRPMPLPMPIPADVSISFSDQAVTEVEVLEATEVEVPSIMNEGPAQ